MRCYVYSQSYRVSLLFSCHTVYGTVTTTSLPSLGHMGQRCRRCCGCMSVGASLDDMDRHAKADRSRMMSSVRARDTQPEIIVRSTLHRLGFRFRLHRADLPGKPDIVLPRLRKVIFVHGCFWHQHQGCSKAKRPHTNLEFWNAKLDRNIARDLGNYAGLDSQSWEWFVIWECETRQSGRLVQRLMGFLGGRAIPSE